MASGMAAPQQVAAPAGVPAWFNSTPEVQAAYTAQQVPEYVPGQGADNPLTKAQIATLYQNWQQANPGLAKMVNTPGFTYTPATAGQDSGNGNAGPTGQMTGAAPASFSITAPNGDSQVLNADGSNGQLITMQAPEGGFWGAINHFENSVLAPVINTVVPIGAAIVSGGAIGGAMMGGEGAAAVGGADAAASAAPAVFNPAVDSQLASSALGITGSQSAADAAIATTGVTSAPTMAEGLASSAAGATPSVFNPAVDSQAASSQLGITGQQAAADAGAATGVTGSPVAASTSLLSPAQQAALTKAATGKAMTAAESALATGALQALGGGATNLINAAGIAGAAAAAIQAGALQATGATDAAAVLSAASTQAAKMQSDAALSAAGTLSTGALQGAQQQVAGQNAAIDTAKSTLATQTTNQQPYMTAGTDALKTLSAGLQPGGQFNKPFTMADAQNTPAMQFAQEQGMNTIQNSAAAKGGLLTSNTNEGLVQFGQANAAQYEQQAFNQWLQQNNLSLGALQNMVQTGQVSTAQLQSALSQAGVSIGTAQAAIGTDLSTGTTNAAQATAAGTMGSAKDLATGVTGSANAQAGGITGAANANAAGLAGAANILAAGAGAVGNSLNAQGILGTLGTAAASKNGAIPTIPGVNTNTMGSATPATDPNLGLPSGVTNAVAGGGNNPSAYTAPITDPNYNPAVDPNLYI
jgi:hypothetical protein